MGDRAGHSTCPLCPIKGQKRGPKSNRPPPLGEGAAGVGTTAIDEDGSARRKLKPPGPKTGPTVVPPPPLSRNYFDVSFALSRRERCLDKAKETRRALRIGAALGECVGTVPCFRFAGDGQDSVGPLCRWWAGFRWLTLVVGPVLRVRLGGGSGSVGPLRRWWAGFRRFAGGWVGFSGPLCWRWAGFRGLSWWL